MSNRPKLSDVQNWRKDYEYSNSHAIVAKGDLMYRGELWSEGAWSVRSALTGKRKLFYGESAWSDAQRYADDLVWEGRHLASIR